MTAVQARLSAALADRYRVERELGAGGMATVYLAFDIKHDRKVAIKVLKPELAAVLGAERFVVEIKTTAALQHPHILPLFDSGTADGFLFYVMPFIEGETLRDKLDRETQFSVDEAVRITSQVADALDYAHRHGVIHRDIKPESILLHDGRPMVADFGIALAVSAAAGGRMTETGLSLGTPHYMSPEQATAEKEITGRSDVYSLASVLYEMLTGNPPHTGASAQQIIMKIITEQAAAVTQFRKSVPPNVAAAVGKALEKLPADRFESAAAFAAALGDRQFTVATTASGAGIGASGYSWKSWLRDPRSLVTVAAAVIAIGAWFVTSGGNAARSATPTSLRFSVGGPADSTVLAASVRPSYAIAEPVVSPNNGHVAFAMTRSEGPGLYLRDLDSFDLFEVPGGGYWPFFSADGAALGFFRETEIWTMDLADRVPVRAGVVADASWDLYAAVWHPDGRILVTGALGLWAVPTRGGTPTILVPADSTRRDRFEDLSVLPDGRIVQNISARDGRRVELISSDGSERSAILPGLQAARVVEDVLFYIEAGQQKATRIDLKRVQPTGAPIVLSDVPARRLGSSVAWVQREGGVAVEPVLVTRSGLASPIGVTPQNYRWPRLSPDGGRLAMGIIDTVSHLEVIDLARRTRSVIGGSSEPTWAVDGRHLFLSRGNRPVGGLLMQVADGSQPPDTVLALETGDAWPTSVSRDGRWLAWYGASIGSGVAGDIQDPNDLFFMDLGTHESRRVRVPGVQRGARFSPDSRWIAYQSTESGREQVHIRPWPSLDANFVISSEGGDEPSWSSDGRELFYRHLGDMMVVSISTKGGVIERSAPRHLFSGIYHRDPYGDQSYDLHPDGRFLMLRPVPGGRVDVQVALNWIDEVNARLERAR
jgi:hypothetical protein